MTMKIYCTKLNSNKHIYCSKRNDIGFTFVVIMLIPANEIQDYFNSKFEIVYKYKDVCLIKKEFHLHEETITVFNDFMNRPDLW